MTVETINAYRVVPRLMGLTFLWLSVDVWLWYKQLGLDASNGDSATVIGVLGVTVGFCKYYMENGKHK